ncbi:hypothetical protein MNAN1_002346 [Malassezia nana]|uniref:Uncharacterized protein n=1 Tax=Malassezia nana TaxID=180528 RepID=A0AAF0EMS3_9BASI|nr:hypothetical protein MNAN1_002346 [Malassezia nana]
MHQAQFGLSHLFVKIPQPLNPREWAHTVFGQAFVCQEQSAPRAPPIDQTRTKSVDTSVHDVSDIELVPEIEEPETALVVSEDTETDEFPPLPEDPFSGTGTQPFDFFTGIRAASQLVGLGRDVLNHPYLQQAAPPLKHVAAFMSALHTPSDAKGMPKVDISQFCRATEQLFDAISSAKQTKPPTQSEVEEMLSQTHATSADEDPEHVTVTEDKDDYYTPIMKTTDNTSESLYTSPLGKALATNFQTLLNEQAASSAP